MKGHCKKAYSLLAKLGPQPVDVFGPQPVDLFQVQRVFGFLQQLVGDFETCRPLQRKGAD